MSNRAIAQCYLSTLSRTEDGDT